MLLFHLLSLKGETRHRKETLLRLRRCWRKRKSGVALWRETPVGADMRARAFGSLRFLGGFVCGAASATASCVACMRVYRRHVPDLEPHPGAVSTSRGGGLTRSARLSIPVNKWIIICALVITCIFLLPSGLCFQPYCNVFYSIKSNCTVHIWESMLCHIPRTVRELIQFVNLVHSSEFISISDGYSFCNLWLTQFYLPV